MGKSHEATPAKRHRRGDEQKPGTVTHLMLGTKTPEEHDDEVLGRPVKREQAGDDLQPE